jgi:hypothetical protein
MKGRLFVRTLLPDTAQRRFIGGPMRLRTVPSGPLKSTPYYGGDVLGYEHRLWPATFLRSPNAAYRLGKPTNLNPHFGAGSTWGRLDVSPRDDRREVVFLHVLVPTNADTTAPPAVRWEIKDQTGSVHIELPDQHVQVDIDLSDTSFDHVLIREASGEAVIMDKAVAKTVIEKAT